MRKDTLQNHWRAYINGDRSTVCDVCIFLRETSQLFKIHQPNSLRTNLMIYIFSSSQHAQDYSETRLNKHPSTADTQNITDNSKSPGCPSNYLSNPWIPDTPLRITNSVHAPNYTEPRLQKYTGSPWVSDTSLQGTKCCLPMVSVIEEFHCSIIPVAPVFGHLQ